MIDVIIPTHNHEPYIEQAVNSVLEQDQSLINAVLVCDDHSTDRTAEIVNHLAKNSNGKIRHIRREKNLGRCRNLQLAVLDSQSAYIALLEGDDYWCYPDKLRRQFDRLEEDRAIVASCHSLLYHDLKNDSLHHMFKQFSNSHKWEGLIDIAKELQILSTFAHVNSLLVRTAVLQKIFTIDMSEIYLYDILINWRIHDFGEVYYHDFIGAVYRAFAQNSYSNHAQNDKIGEFLKSTNSIYPYLVKHRGSLSDHVLDILLNCFSSSPQDFEKFMATLEYYKSKYPMVLETVSSEKIIHKFAQPE
ncbi:MAG: glycosyltransferase family 2 protein [Candidatus Pacebacteria bacterium]|nr:glycosyltransferase family 2 protein [Candidatus Paceibacterota bacterium]